ncbi:MAG: NCS2 family permease [Clostridiales bacterium]|uniref:NCS2 family permease n=1 Tax=Clostridium sp. N3C TaxID=1776758 RepID=UPI00092E1CF7|nr:NCS2 family permease [Clostridium sp. N3C]NLZ48920.1 NCS2 family permease [Clostridiales bacterium]SCN22357.1 putative adenine permease PurP [Clostridium sp. N3C]
MSNFFKLEENNTTVKTEIIAGITTFVTMAYIIFVNPQTLAEAGMDKGAVFVATIISAVIGTLIMAFVANVPFAQAAGMGLNTFFTYSVVIANNLTWQQGLACVFICGLINILITATKVRTMIINAIPESLQNAIGAGIGLFITIIGLINGGIIEQGGAFIKLGDLSQPGPFLAIIGLVITVVLVVKNVTGAILIGILSTTVIGILGKTVLGIDFPVSLPETWSLSSFVSTPPSLKSTLLQLDLKGLFASNLGITSIIAIIVSFSFVDTFDSIGTFIGASAKTGMFDEKNDPPKGNGRFSRKIDKALFADATATSIGALLGTSNVTTYVESSAGISVGGRTGLTSVVTAICFLLTLFLAPVVGLVPSQATAPALIVVGVLMMSSITKINFDDFEEAAPAFLTITMMPFAYSIADGIASGFIFYVIVKVAKGKFKDIHPIMAVLAILFIIKFAFNI